MRISPGPLARILEICSPASECVPSRGLPFESRVARAIKQKRLANRDKNPTAIFFCSLPHRIGGRKEGGEGRGRSRRVVKFRACQHGQKTNAVVVVVFRLFQASFVWRPRSWLLETRGAGVSWESERRGARRAFEEEGRGRYGVAWLGKATFECHRKREGERSFI